MRQLKLSFVGAVDAADAALAAHRISSTPGWAEIPVELGFVCEPRGIPDLLEGRITLAAFCEAIGERWWGGRLERIVDAATLAEALERLSAAYERDPVTACRQLFFDLVAPFAQRSGEPGLVEHTPGSLVHAPTLDRIFGEARFVHALRDGREVAAKTLARRTAGELAGAVQRWAAALRRIDAGVRVREDGASYGVWPDRLRVEMLEPAADPGRGWESGLSRHERRRVERRYARTLRELAEEGVHCAPALIEARERAGR